MVIRKLIEESRSVRGAIDAMLGRESALERMAQRENKIFVHCYVVAPHLRRRVVRKKRALKLVQGGRT